MTGPSGNVAAVLRYGLLGGLVLLAAYGLSDVLLLVFAAVLIACVLRGAAERLARATGVGPGWCLAAIVVLLVAALGLAGWWRGPGIAAEGARVWEELSDRSGALKGRLGALPWGAEVADRVRAWLHGDRLAGAVAGVATSTLGALGSLVVVLASALYFAASPGVYVAGTLRLLPIPWRPRAGAVLSAMGAALRGWFEGQLLDMAVVCALSGAGLALLGVPLAVTLALIAGAMNFVPYVGAIAGAVPAVLVALGQGPDRALAVAGLYLVIQGLEGNVIAPLIQRRTVSLPPVVTILSQTVLGTLFGPLGLVLATPLAAAGMVFVRMAYVGDVLGDRAGEGN